MNWKYRDADLVEVPEGKEAFVYKITFGDGTKYIGKKNFFSRRRMKVKGRIRRKVVVRESNWKVYLSSSEVVKEKIKQGEEVVGREILHLCDTVGGATWFELVEMILQDVLCDEDYLNKNILARFFRCFKENE